MVGDLLQDDQAGQDEAHRAAQPGVGLLAAAGAVPLAVLRRPGSLRPCRDCCTLPPMRFRWQAGLWQRYARLGCSMPDAWVRCQPGPVTDRQPDRALHTL